MLIKAAGALCTLADMPCIAYMYGDGASVMRRLCRGTAVGLRQLRHVDASMEARAYERGAGQSVTAFCLSAWCDEGLVAAVRGWRSKPACAGAGFLLLTPICCQPQPELWSPSGKMFR